MSYRVRNIGVAVALALVAALMVTFYVTNFKRNVQAGEEPVTVYVASQNIPEGTLGAKVIESSWLEKQEVERKNVTPGAISDPKQIEDAVATQPVYAGEQVTTLRFQSDSKRGLRAELSGNMRALQVPGDENQLLKGVLKDGDHVDVVVEHQVQGRELQAGPAQDGGTTGGAPNGEELLAARVVLRDILVLRGPAARGQRSEADQPERWGVRDPGRHGQPGPEALLRHEERRLVAPAPPDHRCVR